MNNEPGEDFQAFSARWKPRLEQRLEQVLQEACRPGCPADLSQAMKYAVLGEAKRLRPLFVLACCRACGGREEEALDAACVVELVHAYSLVHDDLPALDDDDFRRGRPSCHRAFGEGLAILTGDALLTHAFFLLARALPPSSVARAVEILAGAAGPFGMVGGQADDIRPRAQMPPAETVESLQERKTAALFSAAAQLGGLAAGADESALSALGDFGRFLGLAFQIVDDLLSLVGDEKTLGRPSGSDARKGRPLHPLSVGSDYSRQRIAQLCNCAAAALQPLGPSAALLGEFAQLVLRRMPA